jgi:hypothetical protein
MGTAVSFTGVTTFFVGVLTDLGVTTLLAALDVVGVCTTLGMRD